MNLFYWFLFMISPCFYLAQVSQNVIQQTYCPANIESLFSFQPLIQSWKQVQAATNNPCPSRRSLKSASCFRSFSPKSMKECLPAALFVQTWHLDSFQVPLLARSVLLRQRVTVMSWVWMQVKKKKNRNLIEQTDIKQWTVFVFRNGHIEHPTQN